jgi:hypothetical protein
MRTYPEGNRFLVYRYNHSATAPVDNLSKKYAICLYDLLLGATKKNKPTPAGFEPALYFFVRTRTLLLVVNETYPEGNRFLVYRYNHSATAPDLEILLKVMLNNETIMQDSNVCEP